MLFHIKLMRDMQSSLPFNVPSPPHFVKNTELTSIEGCSNATTKARDAAKPACRRKNIAD
ncbi:MAG: hypothetical protein OXI67_11645 [Candidatus Poribacteria bacterium]|nr:hypothetical protein [Candidatus Poribacteria bacterium]